MNIYVFKKASSSKVAIVVASSTKEANRKLIEEIDKEFNSYYLHSVDSVQAVVFTTI